MQKVRKRKNVNRVSAHKQEQAASAPQLKEEFEKFVEYHSGRRLSNNLRSLLLEFLMYDGSSEAEYLKDLLVDLDGLFALLEAIARIQRTKEVKESMSVN